MTKNFQTMSKRITDEDGEVATLPDEFFEKAERGMPQPLDAVSALNATSKAMKPLKSAHKAAIADDTNTATSPKTKLKNRA